jgi:Na+-driven multidrug efflux pump
MKDLEYEHKNIYAEFFRYVGLSTISMISLAVLILFDAFFVANGIGVNGIAALNIAIPVFIILNALGFMFGFGAATRYAVLKVNNNDIEANKVFTNVFWVATIVSIIFTLAGVFFSYEISRLLGANDYIIYYTKDYLRVTLYFSSLNILSNVLGAFVRNDDNPKLETLSMTIACGLNLVSGYVFIYIFHMGTFGAALATGVGYTASLLILSIHFITKRNGFKIIKNKINLQDTYESCAIGLPTFITEVSSGIIVIFFNFAILRLAGNTGVAAYSIILNLTLIFFAIFTGIGQGVQPIISKNLALKKIDNIKKILYASYITAITLGIIFYLIGFLFSYEIIGIFNRYNDPLLFEIATTGIRIYFLSFFFMGANVVTSSFFAAVLKSKESIIISSLRGIILVIPFIIILPIRFGLNGVWASVVVVEIITFVISIFYIKRYYKGVKKEVDNIEA